MQKRTKDEILAACQFYISGLTVTIDDYYVYRVEDKDTPILCEDLYRLCVSDGTVTGNEKIPADVDLLFSDEIRRRCKNAIIMYALDKFLAG